MLPEQHDRFFFAFFDDCFLGGEDFFEFAFVAFGRAEGLDFFDLLVDRRDQDFFDRFFLHRLGRFFGFAEFVFFAEFFEFGVDFLVACLQIAFPCLRNSALLSEAVEAVELVSSLLLPQPATTSARTTRPASTPINGLFKGSPMGD